jgi:hypothetical protein
MNVSGAQAYNTTTKSSPCKMQRRELYHEITSICAVEKKAIKDVGCHISRECCKL